MAAQAQYHDQSTGWTWGGVLKGVATVIGAAVVGCIVWSGIAMGIGAATGNLAAGSTAAWMVGASEGLTSVWQIPGQFAGFIGAGAMKAAELVTGTVNDKVVAPVTELGAQALDGAKSVAGDIYKGGEGLVKEYGKTAAVVAGAGAAGYWAGKVGGRKEQAQNFRDMVTKGREQAALNQLGKA